LKLTIDEVVMSNIHRYHYN